MFETDMLILGFDSLDSVKCVELGTCFDGLDVRGVNTVSGCNTQSAWPSIYTGLDPADHGVTPRPRETVKPWDQSPIYLTFFEKLKLAGYRNVVVGMPVTYTPSLPGFGDFCMAGFPLPQPSVRTVSSEFYPTWLSAEFGDEYRPYLWSERDDWCKDDVTRAALQGSIRDEFGKVDIVCRLLDRFRPGTADLVSIGVQFGDICGHCKLHYPLRDTYDRLCELLDLIRSRIEYNRLLIVSDHGVPIRDWRGIPFPGEPVTQYPHRSDTAALISDPGFRSGADITSIKDVYGIVLDHFGVPRDLVPRGTRDLSTLSEEVSIRKRLSDLGYL